MALVELFLLILVFLIGVLVGSLLCKLVPSAWFSTAPIFRKLLLLLLILLCIFLLNAFIYFYLFYILDREFRKVICK